MPFEIIVSQGRGIGPQALPDVSGGGAEFAAAQRLAQATEAFGQQLAEGQRHLDVAKTTTSYQTGLEQLDAKFAQDADFRTAPQRFAEEETRLREEHLGRISDPRSRAELETRFTARGLSYLSGIRTKSLAREADEFVGTIETQQAQAFTALGKAGSDVEKQAIVRDFQSQLDTGARAGWITPAAAAKRLQEFTATTQSADLMQVIRDRPDEAQRLLQDPARFTALTPTTRQAYLTQAQAANDDRQVQRVTNLAHWNPGAAVATIGRITDPKHVDAVFAGIIGQESGGNPNVGVSSKGAAGLTQMIPDTARAMAAKAGRTDVAAMDDAQVRKTLSGDPALAYRLGRGYFQENLTRFNGYVPAAIAAYHAGPGAAQKAYDAAVAKHGDTPTPAQFVAELPAGLTDGQKTTRDYVTDVYGRLGADPRGVALSTGGSYRAAASVGGVLTEQEAEAARQRNALLAARGGQADEITELYKRGYPVDPQRAAQLRSELYAGAQAGNAEAGRRFAALQEAERSAPIIARAYGSSLNELEAAIGQRDAQIRATGDASPSAVRELDLLKGVAREMHATRETNPRAILERSGAEPVALDVRAQPPAMDGALTRIAAQAEQSRGRYGGPMVVFKPEERAGLKDRFTTGTDADKLALLGAVSRSMTGDTYDAAVKEIAGDNPYALTAGRYMASNPQLSAKILKGATFLEAPDVKPKADDTREALKATLGGDLFPPSVQNDVITAALAVYAADRGRNGTLWDASDRNALQGAIEQITGKVTTIGGLRVPIPTARLSDGRPLEEWHVRTAIQQLTSTDLAAMGTPVDGRTGVPLDLEFLRGRGTFRAVAPNDPRMFLVIRNAGGDFDPVRTREGRPIALDVVQFADRTQQRLAAEPQVRRPTSTDETTMRRFGGGTPQAQEPLRPLDEALRLIQRTQADRARRTIDGGGTP